MIYFPTPFNFDSVMGFLGALIDGQGYMFTYTSTPTDAASYAANVTWMDTKTQPTWAYISSPSGAGWLLYNIWYQANTATTCGTTDAAFATVTALIPAAQVQSDWNAVSGLGKILNKPSFAMVATSGSYTDLSNTPAARSQASATRTLNTIFQPSSTRDVLGVYSVQIQVTASISGGQNGDVILEIASNSGFTANVQTLAISGVGQTYTLAVALQGVQPNTQPLMGFIPTGYYARLRTVNNTGTPTFTYRAGQETLL